MPLTLIKEDGTGKVDANTYASVADGDAYHDGHLYASAWTAATTGNKEKALVMATRLIDAEYQFNGGKKSSLQSLQWPRENCPDPDGNRNVVARLLSSRSDYLASDKVPKPVIDATCEMARELLIANRTASPAGEGIVAEWTATTGTKYSKGDTCPIISYVAQAMLAKYGSLVKSKSGAVRRAWCDAEVMRRAIVRRLRSPTCQLWHFYGRTVLPIPRVSKEFLKSENLRLLNLFKFNGQRERFRLRDRPKCFFARNNPRQRGCRQRKVSQEVCD